jgi:hypothetical protein
MINDEQIESLLGEKALKYLKNKERGGSSNQKGNTYENVFAIYQIALLGPVIWEQGQSIDISSQVMAFVDDLIIDYCNENFVKHFQLKATQVSWDEGEHPIAEDFCMQFQINEQLLQKKSEINLVVPFSQLRQKLLDSIPGNIQSYTQVCLFSCDPNLRKVLQLEPNFRQAIEYLCAFDNPSADKIECVASVLLGAWMSIDKKNVSIAAILKRAQQSSPSYIRSFVAVSLDPDVESILESIQGLTYEVSRGFLKWQFRGLQEGTLSYSCDDERFTAFQNHIKKNCPATFDELEGLLI